MADAPIKLETLQGALEQKRVPAKRVHAHASASRWSRLIVDWLTPLVALGFTRQLNQPDIGPPPTDMNARVLHDDFRDMWEAEIAKAAAAGGKKPSLFRMVFRYVRREWALLAFYYLLQIVLMFLVPMLLGVLIMSFESPDSSTGVLGVLDNTDRWIISAMFFVLPVISGLLLAHHNAGMDKIGLKLRTAISFAVYNKSLRLNSASRQDTSVGQVVNIMSNDANRFEFFMQFANNIWAAPIMIVAGFWLIYQMVGVAMFSAAAVVLVLIPMMSVAFRAVFKLRMSILVQTDVRLKLVNELLGGIRIVKYYGWEKVRPAVSRPSNTH
jgi:ABC-type bacteriocin/lantibiotic exporter with double-glycine peptidase domain